MSTADPSNTSCPGCGDPLSVPAARCPRCAGDPSWATSGLRVGEVLDDAWRLEALIGRGGMGAVFLATDLRLRRKVAVKALSAELTDEEFLTRFEREARVLAMLDHPNIVTLHAVGRHRGAPYLVMKLIDGEPLRAWAARRGGRLGVPELLLVARQAGSALGYLHARGVIHRDLKPSNLMVAEDGRLTVFDLGIARPHDSNLTRTGVVYGTPGYMAPELIVGDRQLDGRLDQYALAVILYELLAGRPPFTADGEEHLLRAHLMKPRPDVTHLRPDLPSGLGPVLARAMAVHPQERFPDAEALVAALEAACEPEAPAAAPRPRRAPFEAGRTSSSDAGRTLPGAERASTDLARTSSDGGRHPADAGRTLSRSDVPRHRSPPRPKASPTPQPDRTAPALEDPEPAAGQPAGPAMPPRRRRASATSALAIGVVLAAVGVLAVLASERQPRPQAAAPPAPASARPVPLSPRALRKVVRFDDPRGHGELQINALVGGVAVGDAAVSVDGKQVGVAPVLVPVKPGRHTVRLAREALPAARFEVDVPGRRSVSLQIDLAPEEAPPAGADVIQGRLEN